MPDLLSDLDTDYNSGSDTGSDTEERTGSEGENEDMVSEHTSSEETDPASANDRDSEGKDMETEQHIQMDAKKQMNLRH